MMSNMESFDILATSLNIIFRSVLVKFLDISVKPFFPCNEYISRLHQIPWTYFIQITAGPVRLPRTWSSANNAIFLVDICGHQNLASYRGPSRVGYSGNDLEKLRIRRNSNSNNDSDCNEDVAVATNSDKTIKQLITA